MCMYPFTCVCIRMYMMCLVCVSECVYVHVCVCVRTWYCLSLNTSSWVLSVSSTVSFNFKKSNNKKIGEKKLNVKSKKKEQSYDKNSRR
jgi:hypothetical protein